MIKLALLTKNPLSLQPLIAEEQGFFAKYNLAVEIDKIGHFPAFKMDDVTAQVGDTTRIFEHLKRGNDLIITSDLTRTMKLIIRDDYKPGTKLKILAAKSQSLGIYTEEYCKQNQIEFEYVTETSMQKRVAMIADKQVDGACMIDPFLIQFIGNGYQLVDEGKNYSDNYTCWAFKRQYLIEYGWENIYNFHRALNEASQYYNQLSAKEKIATVKKHLDYQDELKTYYEQLTFAKESEYSADTLAKCYAWKCQKEPEYLGLDLTEVIFKWPEN